MNEGSYSGLAGCRATRLMRSLTERNEAATFGYPRVRVF
jgi:hypothetical protein